MNKQKIKYAIIIIIIGLAGFGVYRYTDFFDQVNLPEIGRPKLEETEEENGIKFPEGWEEESSEEDVVVKLSKETDTEIAANIVITKEENIEYETPEKYADRLIAGAKSTLPSLVYTDDQLEDNDQYLVRYLNGYYWQGGQQVGLSQKIYVGEDTVYVITASYDYQLKTELEEEINQNFDLLAEKHL
jgi:hypothetical protein